EAHTGALGEGGGAGAAAAEDGDVGGRGGFGGEESVDDGGGHTTGAEESDFLRHGRTRRGVEIWSDSPRFGAPGGRALPYQAMVPRRRRSTGWVRMATAPPPGRSSSTRSPPMLRRAWRATVSPM